MAPSYGKLWQNYKLAVRILVLSLECWLLGETGLDFCQDVPTRSGYGTDSLEGMQLTIEHVTEKFWLQCETDTVQNCSPLALRLP